jgi:cytochrome c-type biogenesis protein CcmH
MTERRRIANRKFRIPLFCVLAALLLSLGSVGTVHAQRSEEARALSKRLMCVCGCNQVLGECNHVGCTVSTEMLRKLDERVAGGESADLILQSFVQEYGEQALAEPMAVGFNRLIYILAWLVPVLGFVLVTLVVRRWRAARPAPMAPERRIPRELLEEARRRADRETEEDFAAGGR